jgi:ubiquinone/menaquinone biosynthesis C-methylase UbiE
MENFGEREKQILERAKQGFEKDLFAGNYDQIHLDRDHLTGLLDLCQLVPDKRYLDLGTGNGFVAFELARQNPRILVTGLDIVHKAVAANNRKAKIGQNRNLDFVSYLGAELPFARSEYFGVVSRYAFHHFPDATLSAAEIYRVLEPDGFCIVADPVPARQDETDFINQFMALKDDGHVRFHSAAELDSLFKRVGFSVEKQFSSSMRFPRPLNGKYERLIEETSPKILQAYRLRIEGNQVYVTVDVLNTCFRRN